MRNLISPITLGTAQLGLTYGVANKIGKPSIEVAHKILRYAVNAGITTFDTSPAYGESESIIGSFLTTMQKEKLRKKITPITKIPPSTWRKISSRSEIYNNMKASIEKSQAMLGLDTIPFCLLHSATVPDIQDQEGVVIDQLLKIKEEGLIQKIGASVYTLDEVRAFLRAKNMDAIEVPINLFDQSLIRTNILQQLKERRKIVFARSIFLQGLFFLKNEDVPNYLLGANKYLQKLQALSQANHIPINQLAFNFVRGLPSVTSLVLGVETIEQLIQNVNLLKTPKLSPEIVKQILLTFQDVPQDIYTPSLWKK